MKIAAVSDIHGNLPALEAVLADIAAQGVDVTVNLGDIASGPLWPRETLERLMPLGMPTIAGNHERQVLTDPRGASDAFAAAQVTSEQRAWMQALPPTRWLADDVFLCHATPTSDLHYWLESLDDGAATTRLATPVEIRERVAAADLSAATLVLCGHTHVPRTVVLNRPVSLFAPASPPVTDPSQLTFVVNAGSVGLQAYEADMPHPHVAENGTPHARYALIERHPVLGWHVTHRMVEYDWHVAAERADAGRRPEWARALRTGRVTE